MAMCRYYQYDTISFDNYKKIVNEKNNSNYTSERNMFTFYENVCVCV